ncbi:MAG: response regulator transcription factor [Dehalococcoidia bacterium]|nr:response regulator transcription factor [Dehalococcoidia bacterium]
MASQTRVLIVDDHDVVREGLRALLRRREELALVGEADSVAAAIQEARRTEPDVVIMDVRLPDGSGVEACREIRSERPETKVIMLTSYADDEAVLSSIMAGASGYLLKQTRSQDLVAAIGRVAGGESLLDPAVTQRVLDRVRSGAPGKDDKLALLSEQEEKILYLIAEGKTNKEIAQEVYLSDKTVKNYVSSILSKLNLRRRSEAAAFIARRQKRPPDD